MSARAHPLGSCTCRTHLTRPWNRSEHWTAREVARLEARFGLDADESLARSLGRSIVGIRLKAKRLGLHKRDTVDYSAATLAEALGLPCSKIVGSWIAMGLLRARGGCVQGRYRMWSIAETDARAFLRDHPQLVDIDRIPAWSPFFGTVERWYSLPEIHRLTGRSNVGAELLAGTIRGRRRGRRWYVPGSEFPRIRRLGPDAIADSVFRREGTLERRRNRRKGVAV